MATATEQLMERITKLPLAQKVGVLVATAVLITGGNYYFFVMDAVSAVESAYKKKQSLEDEMIQNQQIAKNLNQYRKQKEALEQELAKALTMLPVESNVEGLIGSLNEMGSKAGLAINTIDPKPETNGPGGLYAEVPLAMSVTGNFHEIAVFFDSVRQLKRIINISNIHLGHARVKNEKVLIDATYTATAFRFVEQKAPPKEDDKAKDAGKGKGGKSKK